MPRQVDAKLKRSEFVDATWRVIQNEGLSAATLRRVAAEAGCTTGALTHYFRSREALLIAGLRSAHSKAAGRMLVVTSRVKGDLKRLEASVLEALPLDAERLEEWRTRLAFWGAVADSEALRRENGRRFAEWNEFLQERLAPIVHHPEALKREVVVLAALVDGLALRLLVQCRSGEQAQATAPQIAAHVRAHLQGLRLRYG
jgi:AcrR family transcriptional regulator